ncbi:MAG: penicillin-binding protein 1C [Deltaproteobacteria bacterium]|nr:penicillin-binding protein 1C [Deltaproteobacteria bacterium]
MSMTPMRIFRRLLVAFLLLTGIMLVVFLARKPPLLGNVSFSRTVFDRHGQLLRMTLSKDEKYRLFTPLKDISPQFSEMVLLHEDRYFYTHIGFNPVSLLRAFGRTYIVGGRKIGASTITMQLARIKYGINSRHLAGKLWQIARALQLEVHYSKDEILEAYLNLASYGHNIEGAGAAGFIYFHTRPRDLTLPQAVTLAVIPQSPTRRSPESHHPDKPALLYARNRLFGRWLEGHPDAGIQKVFFSLPLATYGVKDLPFESPHLTNNLLARYKDRQQITATIDLETQRLLTRILAQYIGDRRDRGLQNAGAVLVDTQTMQVRASIGSAGFWNKAIQGQVDGTRAKRSPGSALKPFIYALALDQGLIHPLSILGDTPVSFGSYTPDNFDRDFRGPVSARNALRLSRNIPAIKLAAQLHNPDLYDFLKTAGVTKLRKKDSYGLSLVLGGAEVSMRELAELYAMLANGGALRPLVLQLTERAESPAKTLLSPEASFVTLDMLSDAPRRYTISQDRIVYWKTGTSNGFRDAWAAGVFGHYVLVVWVGNFNGSGNPAMTGVLSAAPLFFAMVDAVNGRESNRERIAYKARHLHLRKIDVCATTGDLSVESCPAIGSTWFIPGVSPIRNHYIYRRILVDLRTGKRACHYEEGLTAYRIFEVWPSDLQQALQKAGIRNVPLPPWEESCTNDQTMQTAGDGQHPVITSPQPDVEYHAHIRETAEAVPFNASADGEVRVLHWFLNNQYLGTTRPDEPLLWHPQPGRFRVRVVDDRGHSDSTQLRVLLAQ